MNWVTDISDKLYPVNWLCPNKSNENASVFVRFSICCISARISLDFLKRERNSFLWHLRSNKALLTTKKIPFSVEKHFYLPKFTVLRWLLAIETYRYLFKKRLLQKDMLSPPVTYHMKENGQGTRRIVRWRTPDEWSSDHTYNIWA